MSVDEYETPTGPACPGRSRNPSAGGSTCDECPWRRDVAVGRFPPERFIELASTSVQHIGPLFACHVTPEGGEHACVGWLLVDGVENLRVRIAISTGELNLRRLVARGELYNSFGEMAEANGVPAEVVDALGVRSSRRNRSVTPPAT
jgi:hypothetical protein